MAADEFNPYRAPEASTEAPQAGAGVFRDLGPYESPRTLARVTVGLLIAGLILGLLAMASFGAQVAMLYQAARGQAFTEAQGQANDLRIQAIAVLQLLLGLGVGISFLMWGHRAYKNLPALGARDLKYSPGWVIGAFFVPILNFFRPSQIFEEIWKASDPDVAISDGPGRKRAKTSVVIAAWWLTWIISRLGLSASGAIEAAAKTLDDYINLSWAMVGLQSLSCLVTALAIAVVRGITKRQEEKAARIADGVYPEFQESRAATKSGPVETYEWGETRAFGDDPL